MLRLLVLSIALTSVVSCKKPDSPTAPTEELRQPVPVTFNHYTRIAFESPQLDDQWNESLRINVMSASGNIGGAIFRCGLRHVGESRFECDEFTSPVTELRTDTCYSADVIDYVRAVTAPDGSVVGTTYLRGSDITVNGTLLTAVALRQSFERAQFQVAPGGAVIQGCPCHSETDQRRRCP